MNPVVDIRSVACFSARLAAGPPMTWGIPLHYDEWVLDFCRYPGLHVKVEAPGVPVEPWARQSHTWHLYAPNTVYHEAAERPDLVVDKRWVLFALEGALPPLSDRRFLSAIDPDGVLEPLIVTMHELRTGGIGEALASRGLLLAMLGHLIAASHGPGDGITTPYIVRRPGRAQKDPTLRERVDTIVSARLRRPPSLAELAQTLHLSESSLSHRFKAETGMGVIERVRFLRVDAARRLLLEPEASVKSVASALGFSSPYHFSRIFTDIAGMPPSEWLRRNGS
ncbi:MAG: helix-turn-helix transcriptional regulator [Planctomycetes bacterium]|nr:helix-turn-helix transcriptional regulator [Planctomycetota bacterium]